MGLEKLQSVFNNIDDNQADLHDGLPMESVSNRLFDHTFGSNGAHEDVIEIKPIQNAQSPSPLMAIMGTEDTIVNGHSPDRIRVNYEGGSFQSSIDISDKMEKYNLTNDVNPENRESYEIRENRVNLSTIDLSKGDFILEKLFDPTHGSNYADRRPIFNGEAGDLQSDLQLYISPKNTNNLDIRSNKGYGTRGDEPYIVQSIGSTGENEQKFGYDRDFFPTHAAANDLKRLFKYYITTDGLGKLLKENLTNLAVGDGFKLREPFGAVMLPPLPVPMTGWLNTYQQSFQQSFPDIPEFTIFKRTFPGFEGRSGRSNRKPGRQNYSTLVNTVAPLTLAIQGDIPDIFIKNQVNPLERMIGEFEKKDKIASFHKPVEGKPPHSGESGVMAVPLTKGQKASNIGKHIGNAGISTLNVVGTALWKVKNLALKTAVDAIGPLVAIPHLKNPTRKFLDLKPEGGVLDAKLPFLKKDRTKYDDVISKALVDENPQDDDFEAGDFYLKIRDLRDGKHMYFRGYITGLTENVTPTWNPVTYIGRSEDIHTYQKGERDLSFNLRIAPANAFEFSVMYQKIDKLTSLVYPKYLNDTSSLRMQPPFTELYLAHIGSKSLGQFGYIKSLTYTVLDQGDYDVMSRRPRVIDVAIGYQILGLKPPSLNTKFYSAPTLAEIDPVALSG